MTLLWTLSAVLVCLHWADIGAQVIPSGTCDCATFARNNVRPKRPLVTWPAGETSCSASSVARCRLECNKFFRTFEFDALDLVCGSLHEATRVQILFGYRICKSKWHSLGLSEEPICCRKSRPIHCDTLDATRRQNYPHIPHEVNDAKRTPIPVAPAKKKIVKPTAATPQPAVDTDEETTEVTKKKAPKKIPEPKSKTPPEENQGSKKPLGKKPDKEETAAGGRRQMAPKAKKEEEEDESSTKQEATATRRPMKKTEESQEGDEEEAVEEEAETPAEEEKPTRRPMRKQAVKPTVRKRQKPTPKRADSSENY